MRDLTIRLGIASLVIASACSDARRTVTAVEPPAEPPTAATRVVFDCTGSAKGVQCSPAAGPTAAASRGAHDPKFDKILGTPYVNLFQVSFDFNVGGGNFLRSTVAVQNLTVQPFATTSDYATYDGVGSKVFFSAGPTNTGGTAGAVTLTNATGTGTFTATNQQFLTYAEQTPANYWSLKQWIFHLPDATTTFSFQVYVDVGLPNEGPITIPSHAFTTLSVGSTAGTLCGIRTGGTSYCWGWNNYGQNGDGTTGIKSFPVGVLGVGRDLVAIAQGGFHTCGLTTGGQISCWGMNLYGQLGNPTNTGGAPSPTPNPVPLPVALPSGVTSFTQVSAGHEHTCALANTGTVYCWGSNRTGQLTNGTLADSAFNIVHDTPAPVAFPSGVTSFTAVSAGSDHTCALGNTGQIFCWGFNWDGELGTTVNNGSSTQTPTQTVPFPGGVTSFTAVYAGAFQTCALANTNQLYCWGLNTYGELGTTTNNINGNPTPTAQLVPFPSGVTSWTKVSAGGNNSCALGNNGTLYCWGSNSEGQLATTVTVLPNPTPVAIAPPGGLTFTSMLMNGGTMCALTNIGTVYCCGGNFTNQLGNFTVADALAHPTLTPVSMP